MGNTFTADDARAAARVLRLDEFADPDAAVNFDNQRIVNVADPTDPQDAANARSVTTAIDGRINDAALSGTADDGSATDAPSIQTVNDALATKQNTITNNVDRANLETEIEAITNPLNLMATPTVPNTTTPAEPFNLLSSELLPPAGMNAGDAQLVRGDDTRLSDERAPVDGSVTLAKLAQQPASTDAFLGVNAMSELEWREITANLAILNADPSPPTEGQVWYNSTDDVIRYATSATNILTVSHTNDRVSWDGHLSSRFTAQQNVIGTETPTISRIGTTNTFQVQLGVAADPALAVGDWVRVNSATSDFYRITQLTNQQTFQIDSRGNTDVIAAAVANRVVEVATEFSGIGTSAIDPVQVTDFDNATTNDIVFSGTDDNVAANIRDGSIDEAKLDANVENKLNSESGHPDIEALLDQLSRAEFVISNFATPTQILFTQLVQDRFELDVGNNVAFIITDGNVPTPANGSLWAYYATAPTAADTQPTGVFQVTSSFTLSSGFRSVRSKPLTFSHNGVNIDTLADLMSRRGADNFIDGSELPAVGFYLGTSGHSAGIVHCRKQR